MCGVRRLVCGKRLEWWRVEGSCGQTSAVENSGGGQWPVYKEYWFKFIDLAHLSQRPCSQNLAPFSHTPAPCPPSPVLLPVPVPNLRLVAIACLAFFHPHTTDACTTCGPNDEQKRSKKLHPIHSAIPHPVMPRAASQESTSSTTFASIMNV